MQKNANPAESGLGAARVLAPDKAIEFVLGRAETLETFCSALSKLFGVHINEVALLSLDKSFLKFVWPGELKTVGAIPVSSSTAISAHTATTKKVERFNSFAKIPHEWVFETVKLISPANSEQPEQATIQKLMSAPVLDSEKKVLGVIQVCRKGYSLSSAGPDFTVDDLRQLELAARVASIRPFMTELK